MSVNLCVHSSHFLSKRHTDLKFTMVLERRVKGYLGQVLDQDHSSKFKVIPSKEQVFHLDGSREFRDPSRKQCRNTNVRGTTLGVLKADGLSFVREMLHFWGLGIWNYFLSYPAILSGLIILVSNQTDNEQTCSRPVGQSPAGIKGRNLLYQ